LQKAIDNKDTIYGPDGMYRVDALYHFVNTYKDMQLVAKINNTRNLYGRSLFAETNTSDEITIDEDNNFLLHCKMKLN